jgi:hypothetical protein
MGRIDTLLSRLEARLRSIIEGGHAGEGLPRKLHRQLQQELIRVMKSTARQVSNEYDPAGSTLTAPAQYTLLLPAARAELLLSQPITLDRLAVDLTRAAANSGISFSSQPILCVVADPLEKNFRILAEDNHSGMGDSYTTEVEGGLVESIPVPHEVMPKSFLIINGLTTFPISKSVVNIGRDPSNGVCLDDLRVSRMHAQLRLVGGRFVIFDLDSKGGTFVNGVVVSSHALNPGDVIHLAGVPLVYGQETATPVGYTQELPVEPPAPEVL